MENEKLMLVVTSLIASKSEGEYWDFKQDFHENKASLLQKVLSNQWPRIETLSVNEAAVNPLPLGMGIQHWVLTAKSHGVLLASIRRTRRLT